MTTVFSTPYQDFSGNTSHITISTGPVIIDQENNKALLHISSSTGKYQFIGGRLDDSLSFRENALQRAKEVIGENPIMLTDNPPTILLDTIEREGKVETVLLIHYKATIKNTRDIGNAKWLSLDEVEVLDKDSQTSSPNILICSKHFLNQ